MHFILSQTFNMERWQNKVAVVTGASLGIGAAVTKDLVKAGVQVVGLARRKEGLDKLRESLAHEQRSLFTPMQCDVSDLKSVNETFDEIIRTFGGVDILINNAGKFVDGLLVETDPRLIEDMWTTGIMGVVYCTQRAFKSMKEREVDGHVILMNGITGHTPICGVPSDNPVTNLNLCSPSKYPVTAMTEIYRQEFFELGTGVKITVCNL